MGNLLQPIRSTTQIWVVKRHQYGISALVSQTSFRWQTSGSVAKMSAVFSCYNRYGSRISRRGCQLTEKVSPLQQLPQNKVMYKTFSASAQPKGTPYWICPLGMVDELTLCIIKSKLVTEMTLSCNPAIHWTTHNS